MEVSEVLELVDDVTLVYVEEHGVAEDSADEEDEHEEDEDVEERVNRHHDSLEQRLEALGFASQAKHSTDTQHA